MNKATIKKLNQINQDFYNTTADDFDGSRQFFWKGWENLITHIGNFDQPKILDLGCGNGRFYQFLKKKLPEKKLSYLGIDSNQDLLKFAKEKFENNNNFELQTHDIVSSLLNESDFIKDKNFDAIVSFGVFHHIPSFKLRLQLLNYLKTKLSKNGLIIISLWQFMDYERFKAKVVDHETSDLEKNDYILNWNRGKKAIRYCHFINEEEQDKLVSQSGLRLTNSFRSDGREQNVNKYLILKK